MVVSCSVCARGFRFAAGRARGATDAERYRRAKEYAEGHGIDLATAYSILEGIMTLEEARGEPSGPPARGRPTPPPAVPAPAAPARPVPLPRGSARATSAPAAPAPRAVKGAGPEPAAGGTATAPAAAAIAEVAYDPGFADAVRDGCLTIQQAMERGDRQALALRLAHRHRLPTMLALKVADNRMTVRQAVAQKLVLESREPPRPQTSVSHGVWNFMVYSVGAMILAGLGAHVYHVWGDFLAERAAAALSPRMAAAAPRPRPEPPPAAVPAPPPPLTVPRTDATGQLVEIIGPDPKSVLLAFCSTGRQAGRREPVGIAATLPPGAAARLGVYRNLEQPATPLRAVRMRRDPGSGRWVAGDGRTPITTEALDGLPDGIKPVGAPEP
jgi:hypothetical protein